VCTEAGRRGTKRSRRSRRSVWLLRTVAGRRGTNRSHSNFGFHSEFRMTVASGRIRSVSFTNKVAFGIRGGFGMLGRPHAPTCYLGQTDAALEVKLGVVGAGWCDWMSSLFATTRNSENGCFRSNWSVSRSLTNWPAVGMGLACSVGPTRRHVIWDKPMPPSWLRWEWVGGPFGEIDLTRISASTRNFG
jgi:hypothetical protein